MDESINTANKKQSRQKPPLSITRIVGEIIVGTVMGFVIAVPATIAILYVFLYIVTGQPPAWSDTGEKYGVLSLAVLLIAILSFIILYILSTAFGVYLVGNIGRQTGSFLLTLGCGFLLGGLSIFLVLSIPISLERAFVERGTIYISGPLVIVLLIPPILGTFVFNLTRKYKEHKKQTKSSKKRLQIFLMVLAICSIVPAMMYIGSCGLIIPLILFALALVFK